MTLGSKDCLRGSQTCSFALKKIKAHSAQGLSLTLLVNHPVCQWPWAAGSHREGILSRDKLWALSEQLFSLASSSVIGTGNLSSCSLIFHRQGDAYLSGAAASSFLWMSGERPWARSGLLHLRAWQSRISSVIGSGPFGTIPLPVPRQQVSLAGACYRGPGDPSIEFAVHKSPKKQKSMEERLTSCPLGI